MHTLTVVAGVLINDKDEMLLVKRPAHKPRPGEWEFPGGKIEAGETAEEALVRELAEELDVTIRQDDCEPFWFLSHTYHDLDFHLLMPVWLIRVWEGTPRAVEHDDLAWMHPDDMKELALLEADDPLVDKLKELISP